MWRCANDIIGLCKTTPDWKEQPVEKRILPDTEPYLAGGSCKLDYHTCGNYINYLDPVQTELRFHKKEQAKSKQTNKRAEQGTLF